MEEIKSTKQYEEELEEAGKLVAQKVKRGTKDFYLLEKLSRRLEDYHLLMTDPKEHALRQKFMNEAKDINLFN